MEMTYTFAFSVYKDGVKDDDGMAKVAAVELGLIGGPLGGIAVEGILIKQHPTRGLQVVFPAGVKIFTDAKEVERSIITLFAQAFKQVVEKPAAPEFHDFSGVPEPEGWSN